ncbi:DUF7935 family protein [Mucilaginibacter ginkgonis]|uniref:Uncharacterized protein n=1 Tax=Mucilaginibacter ginkgonis TaxID=2682091 RepID=A0A6I4HZD5_9SPHI|nr:hypothetical protein [Mucilaginibacter ginkgonis]QQL48582.1 hypothetical protein GO620_010345 [Mucilaginibacter ginkgonis]
MITVNYLLEIVKFTIAGVGVVWVAFYLLKPYLDKSERIQILELKKAVSNQTIPLRLQAYERLVLFIDRINPANMLIRLNATSYTAKELQAIIVSEIRNEFQHNISQQIYISTEAWAAVKKIKDDTLSLVNNMIAAMPADARGLEVSRQLIGHLAKLEDNPYDAAAEIVRKDLEGIF